MYTFDYVRLVSWWAMALCLTILRPLHPIMYAWYMCYGAF